jgi:hypothetical protein
MHSKPWICVSCKIRFEEVQFCQCGKNFKHLQQNWLGFKGFIWVWGFTIIYRREAEMSTGVQFVDLVLTEQDNVHPCPWWKFHILPEKKKLDLSPHLPQVISQTWEQLVHIHWILFQPKSYVGKAASTYHHIILPTVILSMPLLLLESHLMIKRAVNLNPFFVSEASTWSQT